MIKNNSQVTIGVLVDPLKLPDISKLLELGYSVKLILPGDSTSKMDYLYIPHFEGFSTNIPHFFNYPHGKPPIGNWPNHIEGFVRDKHYRYLYDRSVRIICEGNSFIMMACMWQVANELTVKLIIEGGIVKISDYRDPIQFDDKKRCFVANNAMLIGGEYISWDLEFQKLLLPREDLDGPRPVSILS
jgi:hypothetical protein